MVAALGGTERSISELAAPFKMSLTAVSKHVRVLERAGLLRRTKRGRTQFCRVEPRPLTVARDWIAAQQALWQLQFDQLDTYLAKDGAR